MAQNNTIHIIKFRPRRYQRIVVERTDRASSIVLKASDTINKASKQ